VDCGYPCLHRRLCSGDHEGEENMRVNVVCDGVGEGVIGFVIETGTWIGWKGNAGDDEWEVESEMDGTYKEATVIGGEVNGIDEGENGNFFHRRKANGVGKEVGGSVKNDGRIALDRPLLYPNHHRATFLRSYRHQIRLCPYPGHVYHHL
jgi:hypothetical protein